MVTETVLFGAFLFIRRRLREMKKFWINYREFRRIIKDNERLSREVQLLTDKKNSLTAYVLFLERKHFPDTWRTERIDFLMKIKAGRVGQSVVSPEQDISEGDITESATP